ncbi:hypothetical protein L345_09122, partial [Ophiophagus hannah]
MGRSAFRTVTTYDLEDYLQFKRANQHLHYSLQSCCRNTYFLFIFPSKAYEAEQLHPQKWPFQAAAVPPETKRFSEDGAVAPIVMPVSRFAESAILPPTIRVLVLLASEGGKADESNLEPVRIELLVVGRVSLQYCILIIVHRGREWPSLSGLQSQHNCPQQSRSSFYRPRKDGRLSSTLNPVRIKLQADRGLQPGQLYDLWISSPIIPQPALAEEFWDLKSTSRKVAQVGDPSLICLKPPNHDPVVMQVPSILIRAQPCLCHKSNPKESKPHVGHYFSSWLGLEVLLALCFTVAQLLKFLHRDFSVFLLSLPKKSGNIMSSADMVGLLLSIRKGIWPANAQLRSVILSPS